MAKLKFDELIKINNIELKKKYIESLSKQERIDLIDPIFNILRDTGFIFPDDESKIKKSYKRLVDYKLDLNQRDLYNNSSIGTDICRYFCAESFYNSTEQNKPTLIENFNDDEKLKKVIGNRLGLDWIDVYNKGPGLNFAFNLSFKMIIQGMR